MSDTFNIKKPFDVEQKLLRERLQFFLNTLHPLLRADVEVSLTSPGKLFYISDTHTNTLEYPSGIWSLLPLLVATCVAAYQTDITYYCSVAVAIECFVCALDLLDDIEDQDQTFVTQKIGSERALNVSTALLALTNHILLSLVQTECPSELVVRLLNTLQEALIAATTGQHRDIMAEQESADSFTLEECIEIAEGKAGSLMSLACSIGALCAGADAQMIAQFAELGKLFGISQQLDNDSHDLYHILQQGPEGPSTGFLKTDILRHKKTLPVVLASHIMSTLQKSSIISDEERQKRYIDALHEGITTTWGMSLLYRERAREQFRQIEMQTSVPLTLRLLLGFK